MLAEMVAAGELPALAERIPANPRILPVVEELGQYGGTWRRAYKGMSDRWGPTKLLEERIVEFMYNEDGEVEIVPNWVDEYEISPDASEFKFHIREGMKWSDGEPVTTEDVTFWYEDVFQNEELVPTKPQYLTSNGEPLTIEIIDDFTFAVKFSAPYPLFPYIMAKESSGAPGLTRDTFLLPAHYLSGFHPNYVSEEDLAAIAAEKGVDTWKDLWGDNGPIQSWWLNPDLPVISAWMIETPPPSERVVMVRNPYYHAVDAEGRQLPYIDYITHDLFEDPETLNLWVVQGLIDMQARHINGPANYTLFKENEEEGDYRLVVWKSGSTDAYYPNLNTPDPVLAELFNDSTFRHALSVAINRDEMNELVKDGLAEARQASPVSGSPSYDAEFESKWTEYDPDTANALLDELGLTERDADGFRLRSDGETLQITITSQGSDPKPLELMKSYWDAVGIKTLINVVERSLYEELTSTGDIEVGEWGFDRNSIIPADPSRYTGVLPDGPWAPLYGQWWQSGGELGVEPPADHPIRDAWAAWEAAQVAPSLEEANALVQEMINVHKENIFVIGTLGETPSIYIVSNKMHNVPAGLVDDDALRGPGIAQPAQFFMTE
ncbi:MAG: ABC transporter substrate-binding protein, partial [Caldilineaceae bacterium]|nr:ABC transporter substrate-binding protein [Caldilineaceae bacterium]